MSKKSIFYLGLIIVIPFIALHIAHYFYDSIIYFYIIVIPLSQLKELKNLSNGITNDYISIAFHLLLISTYIYSFWNPLFIEPIIWHMTLGIPLIMYSLYKKEEIEVNKFIALGTFIIPLFITIIYHFYEN